MTEILNSQTPLKGRRILLHGLSPIQRKLLVAAGLAGGGAIVAYAIRHIMEKGLPNREGLNKGALPPACATPATEPAVAVHAPENVSSAVTDDMDFATAFKAAREDCGPGNFFEWRGRSFNTFFRDEFEALDSNQKTQFYAAVRESLQTELPVVEHTEAAHVADASEPDPAQDQRLPADFDDIRTEGERIDLDQDGDGKMEAVAVDDNGDGYVDRLFSDTDNDGQIDRYLLNADDRIDLEQVLTKAEDGSIKVFGTDKNTVITMDELQPNKAAAQDLSGELQPGGAGKQEEFLPERSEEAAAPPEPGAIVEDFVAIDPKDLAPGETEERPEDAVEEWDDDDPDHAQLPGLENQVNPHL